MTEAVHVKHSIRKKLLATMIGLMVALLATLGFVLTRNHAQFMQVEMGHRVNLEKEIIVQHGRTVSENLRLQAENDIAAFNFSNLSETMRRAVSENPKLDYVFMVGTDSPALIFADTPESEARLLMELGPNRSAKAVVIARLEYGDGERAIMEFAQPLRVGGEHWGVLYVGFSLRSMNQVLQNAKIEMQGNLNATMRRSGLISAGFLVLGVVLVMLMSTRVAGPIRRLTETAQRLSKGDFGAAQDVRADSGDEVGVLANTFKMMAADLERSYRDLETANQRLEERVLARTTELAKSNAQLHDEIAERTRTEVDLRAALTDLEHHNTAKTEFVYNVSHELKTPLASMSQALGNLRDGVVGPLDKPVLDYLDMLHEDCRRLRGTISDVLDLSRIESHTLILSRVRLPFSCFVEHTVASIAAQAREKQIALTVDVEEVPGFVEFDPPKMERVVLNLVQNALKFTTAGGCVVVRVKTQDDLVRLTVTDSGIGIPPEHQEHVMERYYRIGQHVSGTGLGLAICKEIVEMHEGTITLVSPPPHQKTGTQINITLPLTHASTVMLFDVAAHEREPIQTHLRACGFNILTHAGDADGVAAILEARPDVVLLDLVHGDVNAFLGVIALRKPGAALADIRIVALIGAEPQAFIREIVQGANIPTLSLGWNRDDLLTCLQSCFWAA